MDEENFRSACPAAGSLDILGDRWSLLIIRDLLMGKRRYADFQASPEGISTNILADRLKRLQEFGIVEKRSYQVKPTRYEYNMTRRGADLIPILQELCRWGEQHLPECWTPPKGLYSLTPEAWWEHSGWDTAEEQN